MVAKEKSELLWMTIALRALERLKYGEPKTSLIVPKDGDFEVRKI